MKLKESEILMQIYHKNEIIEFTIYYNRGKSIQIEIEYPGFVNVKAPTGVSEESILNIVKSKADIILAKLVQMKTPSSSLKEKKYEEGECFLYLGKEYPLKVIVDEHIENSKVNFDDNYLIVYIKNIEKESVKNILDKFYRKECNKKIKKRVALYQKNFKLKPRSISIGDAIDRWGSCNSGREIKFNSKLIMAPEHVIDYVVVHEMSHMAHMNHSKSFWTSVGKIIPNYKDCSQWLQRNGIRMIDFQRE